MPNGPRSLHHGALTFFLAQQLDKAVPGATYRDVFELAAHEVTAKRPAQHPHCEGARDRVLFERTDVETVRYVLVTETTGHEVTLDAGVPQGVLVGSEWVLCPPGTTSPPEASGACPRIQINSADVTRAKGRLLTPDLPAQLHARAVEVKRPISTRWPIEIYGVPEPEPGQKGVPSDGRDPAGGLRQLIADSPWLKLAQQGEVAQAGIYLLQPRQSVQADDPVPQLKTLSSETWAVVRRDGQLCMRPLLLSQTQGLRDNLEKWARQEMLRELDKTFSDLSVRSDGTEPDEVVDYLKLFITTQPMDFGPLLQESVRTVIPEFRGSDTALGKLLSDVLAGGPAVRSVVSQLTPLHDWATELRAVRILRPHKSG